MFSSSDSEEGNGAEGGDAAWWQGTTGSLRPGERSRRMNGGIGGLSSNSSRLTSRRSSIPCKFYSQPSGCASGKHCKFRHGPTLSGSASFNNLLALGGGLGGGIGEGTSSPSRGERASDGGGPRTPCRFHLRGYCRTGRKCPFLHIGPAGAGGERGGGKATSSLGYRASDGGHHGSPKHGSNLAEHYERKGHNTNRVLGRSISAGFLVGLAGGLSDIEPLTISQSGRMYDDDIDEDGLEGEIDEQHRSLMGERQASQRLKELQAALERQLLFDGAAAAQAHVNSNSTTTTAEREGGEEKEGGYFVEDDGQVSRRVISSSPINTITSSARSLPVTPKSKAAALGGLSRGDGATIDENEIKSMAMSAMEGFGLTSALAVSAVSPGRKTPARSQSHHSLYLLGSPSSRSNSHFSPNSHFSVESPSALDLNPETFVHVPSGLSNNVTESRAGGGGGLGERVSSFHSLDGALSTYGGSNNLHQQHHNSSLFQQQQQHQQQQQQQQGGGQRSGAPGGGSQLPASFLRSPQQSSSTQGPFRGPLYSYGSSNSLAGLVEGENESEVDSLNNGGARNHSLLGVGGGGGLGAGYNSFCATRGGSTLSLFSLHEGCDDDDDDHGDHDFLYGEGDATGLPLIEEPLPTYNQQHQHIFQSSSSNQLRAKSLSNGGFPSSSSLATQEEVYFYGAPGALTSAESATTIVGGGGGYSSSVSPHHHQLLSSHSSYQQQQQQQLSSALSSSSLSSLGTSGLVRTSFASSHPQGVRWAEIVTTTGSDSGSGGSLTPQRLMMYPAATSSSSSTSISTLATTPPLSTSSSFTGIRRSSSSNQLSSTSASSTTINSSRELKICRFFLQGNCVHGMRCRNSHNVNVALTVFSQDLDRGADPPRTMEEIRALDEQEIRQSTNAECHICTEIITGRFGLLTDCPHAFCLNCIRTWRQQHIEGQETSNVRSCPLCKQISHFVIPHTRHVTDPIRKDNLIREYKAQMGKKRCKYYQDREECPFGSSCFYAHLKPDGTLAEPTKVRTRMGAEGNIEVVQEVKLSQFFDLRRG